jgi:hypothetical protein
MAIYLNNNVGVKLATNAAPTVPSVDISSLVTNAVINQIVDELEVTSMGDLSHRFVAGLQSATFSIDFLNEWVSTPAVMDTLNAAFGKTLAVSVITVKGTAVSATNPTYQFSILVNNLTPIGQGGVSEIATSSLSFTVNSAVTVSSSVAF